MYHRDVCLVQDQNTCPLPGNSRRSERPTFAAARPHMVASAGETFESPALGPSRNGWRQGRGLADLGVISLLHGDETPSKDRRLTLSLTTDGDFGIVNLTSWSL
jgi:hypothetical protein